MFTVAALYHFTPFADPSSLREPLLALCAAEGVRGTLLLAREGINGTVAGPKAGIDRLLAHIRAFPGCDTLEVKFATTDEMPFGRMKVRLKREIVTMGEPDIDPRAAVGRYLEPEAWNAFIQEPDVVVIDTRNDYEVSIGTFEGAIDPHTTSFREFPAWWAENKERFHNKRIAMFCTGGIRCEKSTSFLVGDGIDEVYHLKGGVLRYLEEMDEAKSLWHGDCFVFDGRVSVGHGLKEGPHELCHACRRPILPEDRMRSEFEEGVSCHHCADEYDAAAKARFRERQRQVKLAEKRGLQHLGQSFAS